MKTKDLKIINVTMICYSREREEIEERIRREIPSIEEIERRDTILLKFKCSTRELNKLIKMNILTKIDLKLGTQEQ